MCGRSSFAFGKVVFILFFSTKATDKLLSKAFLCFLTLPNFLPFLSFLTNLKLKLYSLKDNPEDFNAFLISVTAFSPTPSMLKISSADFKASSDVFTMPASKRAFLVR